MVKKVLVKNSNLQKDRIFLQFDIKTKKRCFFKASFFLFNFLLFICDYPKTILSFPNRQTAFEALSCVIKNINVKKLIENKEI